MLIPQKLKRGDHVRIISPATSLGVISSDQRQISLKRFAELGITVSFSKNAEEMDQFSSSSIKSRVEDIHEAFADPSVKGVLTTLGGFNSNQLLQYLDYDLIRSNPKVLCGYSDITALQTAIYSKTGLVTYSGPHFSTFGMKYGCEYTLQHFVNCLMQDEPYTVEPSQNWSDDAWFMDQENRQFNDNDGWLVLQEGQAVGTVFGGNLCTLNLLQGTDYFPNMKDIILFIEDDYMSIPQTFDRDLQSLLQVCSLKDQIKAVIIGRFQNKSNMSEVELRSIIETKEELHNIPVISNVNFGHVSPIFTFPVGGKGELQVQGNKVNLSFHSH